MTEWQQIEQWYLENIEKISLPEHLNPAEIVQVSVQLDQLYTRARFDYAEAKRHYHYVERLYKLAQKQAYLDVKESGTNEKEREALIMRFLSSHIFPELGVDIFTALNEAEQRYYFMEAVIDILKEKQSRLITILGSNKLEVALTSVD